MQVKGSLEKEDRSGNFCEHIKKARFASFKKKLATVETISLQKILDKVSEEDLEKAFKLESSDDEITIFHLTGKQIAVPILNLERDCSSGSTEKFVHLKDLKCTMDSCTRKLKSKKHTLVVKGVSLCRHSLLGQASVIFISVYLC